MYRNWRFRGFLRRRNRLHRRTTNSGCGCLVFVLMFILILFFIGFIKKIL